MSRFELTLAAAGLFLLVFAAGWIAALVWRRLAEAASPRSDRADEMVAELLLVEEARDALAAEKDALEAELCAEMAVREERLVAALREKDAELDAAMAGLRSARASARDADAD